MNVRAAEDPIEALYELLRASADEPYIGEPVSQLEHALQAASLAASSGAGAPLVAAALLHDIGHLCAAREARRMPGLGVFDHEAVGAEYLRALGLPESVAAPVERHVRAKRYLVATRPAYAAKLSSASAATLALQGGPMSAVEVTRFEGDIFFREALRLRAWDEQAKIAEWRGPGLDAYRGLLEGLLRPSGAV